MSDIELVIKISESRYKLLQTQARTNLGREKLDEFAEAVLNGTPLPKGHGDLKDADELKNAFINWSMAVQGYFTDSDIASIVDNSPTIIEADIPTMYYPQVEGITPTVISSNGSDMLSAEEIDNLLQALAEGESEE